MTSPPPLLRASALECQRGESLLFSDIHLELSAGQLLQVGGANGTGKTSLLRILAGLGRPVEGEVFWRNENIQTNREHYAAEMAYMGHHLGLKAELTVMENLRFGMALYDKPKADTGWQQSLTRVGLSHLQHLPVRTLSAGQRQRVALARLLATEALLWILDEPFTALDVNGIDLVQALLDEHAGRGGMAVITSHQPVTLERTLLQLSLG
ncbi:cytochrome c biogenesis heme-transporting ATPase CcmA [Candidatus Woesearchaeota archaeon]|nr:cytochrome c biogenesis heme-transporting ATPase CcmA [Candidatus Woesearchaeota archaeon]